jgi:hypothetical protein
MDIYSLGMADTKMASFVTKGTYNREAKNCQSCYRRINTEKTIIAPVQIMFIPSKTTELGDFSYDQIAGPDVIVREQVKVYLEENGYPCTFLPVEVLPPRKKKYVLSYSVTDPLYFLDCTKILDVEIKASNLRPTEPCPLCGKIIPEWDNETLVVTGNEQADTIFQLHPYEERGLFVTEVFIEDMVRQGFSNISVAQLRKIGQFK